MSSGNGGGRRSQHAIASRAEVLYGENEGTQRAIARFTMTANERGDWTAGTALHWRLDGVNPRA